jgi:chromosome segregation ATPase
MSESAPETGTEAKAPESQPETTEQGKPDESVLGDAGKKALDAMKAERNKAAKRASELESRLKEFEDRDKSDLDKVTERATSAEERATKAEQALARLEVALEKGLTPSQAKRLVGTTREELEADAEELLADIGDRNAPRAPKPDPTQGRAAAKPESTPGIGRLRDAYASSNK